MLKDKQVEIQSGPLLVLQKSLELLSRNTKWVKQNFTLGSYAKLFFFFFDTGLLFLRIQAPRATFI